MSAVSVVIITRNEEKNIVGCIRSARQITSDIIVVDCGSEDHTVSLAEEEGASVYGISWKGFGYSRNFGAAHAGNDWIFALDADERISPQLASAVNTLSLSDASQVYRFRRRNHLAGEEIRFGTLGYEKVTRIYNRRFFQWDLSLVHEKLTGKSPMIRKRIDGEINHFGLKSLEDYLQKSKRYAQLSARKYRDEKRRIHPVKRYTSPLFNSLKSYIFQLGFLEGLRGYRMAGVIAQYSWLKYEYYEQLRKQQPARTEFIPSLKPAETA